MILNALVRRRHVVRHFLFEVFGESRVTSQDFNDSLARRRIKLLPGDLGNNLVTETVPG
jgi:hypothetical protein